MKRKCFVLMPFAQEFREVFNHAIKSAAKKAGFECYRGDDPISPSSIISDIITAIFTADAIVADLSKVNPNVFYELGIAHSIANKTIMICEKTDQKLPFDLSGYRTIFYERNIEGIKNHLHNNLVKALGDIDNWGRKPSNPVQNFRPVKYAVPLSEQAELERKIRDLTTEVNRLTSELASRKPLVGTMALIPSGSFLMGMDEGEEQERPTHEVITDAFFMDAYPVTNGQFKKFIEDCPDWEKETAVREYHNVYYLFSWQGKPYPQRKKDHPIVWVNWYAAAAYCNWRSQAEGREVCYDEKNGFICDFDANGYRLPTEAEFEKAARGRLVGARYPWGNEIDESNANYGNIIGDTTEVGRYPPNLFDLYGICGNVKEWCNDWYDSSYYKGSPKRNPIGPASGEFKVFRGGSWGSNERELRCGHRAWLLPPNTNPDFGFRCVKSP